MEKMQTETTDYVLGHTDEELMRLEKQGQFLQGLTKDLLIRAGLVPGMKVLDFGSGTGDVSLLASDIVGPTGEVIALERAFEAIEHARFRMESHNIKNIRFIHGDETIIPEIMNGQQFDAIIGRLVLLHQRDPMETLCKLINYLRPAGIVAFHEIDMCAGYWASAKLPLYDKIINLICDTFARGGMAIDIGSRFAGAFEKAGITESRIVRESQIEFGADSGAYDWISRVAHNLHPAMIKMGMVSENEIDLASLGNQLRDEAVAANASFVPIYFAAAFGRKAILPGMN
jgi:ubiquinone/menaquinone biosynthesis C-methylase UbiE